MCYTSNFPLWLERKPCGASPLDPAAEVVGRSSKQFPVVTRNTQTPDRKRRLQYCERGMAPPPHGLGGVGAAVRIHCIRGKRQKEAVRECILSTAFFRFHSARGHIFFVPQVSCGHTFVLPNHFVAGWVQGREAPFSFSNIHAKTSLLIRIACRRWGTGERSPLLRYFLTFFRSSSSRH